MDWVGFSYSRCCAFAFLGDDRHLSLSPCQHIHRLSYKSRKNFHFRPVAIGHFLEGSVNTTCNVEAGTQWLSNYVVAEVATGSPVH